MSLNSRETTAMLLLRHLPAEALRTALIVL